MENKEPRVCIIGAGCSGITAIKNLVQAGVKNIVCYEQNKEIGGNWVYTQEVSHSSVCETTHIISSKTMSQYEGFPMPAEYPDYPSHRQVLKYFQSYTKEFGLLPFIKFNTKVKGVEKQENNKWEITLENGEQEIFDFLLVANGHHSVPRHPGFKDAFTGKYFHSHEFKNNKGFEGERVLVVGAGNSGCDCAVEISRVAEKVDISIRTPQYIIPKFFLGKPSDTFNNKMIWLPRFVQKPLLTLSLKIQVGDYASYGLERPKHNVLDAHPTLNSELLYKIRHGKVHPQKGIEKVEGKKVFFKEGQIEEYDSIIAATGYQIATPFFEKEFLDYSDSDRVPLYLRMFHPAHPTLIFIGLCQPQGAVWPLSDAQSKVAGNYIMKRWQLPKNIKALAEKDADQIEKEFLNRKRHTVEVHYYQYLRKLKRQVPNDAPQWKRQS
jgi:flavin-binding monooxygenase-like protein